MATVNTDIKNIVISSEQQTQYDQKAKKVLGNKHILSYIIAGSIDEFKGMSPSEVYNNIEGDPIISRVPVEPGMTNIQEQGEKIAGLNTEDAENNEGLIIYDIIVYVRTHDGLAKIILNVEAQKNEPTKYKIINRTIFYACRLISSQKGREFVKQHYNDIKRIYSVWICMDINENCMNHIHLTNDSLLGNHTWKGDIDLLNIILIGLGKEISKANNKDYSLHRLLGTVFSEKLTAAEKMAIMEGEYNIPMEQELKEDLDDMCNLSQGLVEKSEIRGEARGIIRTAEKHGVSKNDILADLQESLNITLQQAQEYIASYGKNSL